MSEIIDELKIKNVIVIFVIGAAVNCIFVPVTCPPLPVAGAERRQVNSEFVSSLVWSCREVVHLPVELKAENQVRCKIMRESNE